MKFTIVLFTCLSLCAGPSVGQSKGSETNFLNIKIGDPFPSYKFTNIDHFDARSANIKDFRGKWLVLDYWAEWCGVCIASMPKMSEIQSTLKNDVQIIMVGKYSNTERNNIHSLRKLYEKVRMQKNLTLAVAYDTVLSNSLKVTGMPDILIIDPKGILRARVSRLTLESLKDIMNGNISNEDMSWLKNNSKSVDSTYNSKVPLSINNNGGSELNYLYRNLVVSGNPKIAGYRNIQENGRLEFINYKLTDLYTLAYIGYVGWTSETKKIFVDDSIAQVLYEDYYPTPILSIQDSSAFFSKYKISNIYSYSLCYPKIEIGSDPDVISIRKSSFLKENLQAALKSCFGFYVRLEIRKMPCYRLKAYKVAVDKLYTKGGRRYRYKSYGRYAGGEYGNTPLISAIISACNHTSDYNRRIPIIDETDIWKNVDITIKAGTIEEVSNRLKQFGLELVLSEKDMNCLVISDKN